MAEHGLALLEIGRVHRAHGLRGEVVVSLVTNVESRLAPGTRLFARDRTEPLEVVASRRHQRRWLVRFAGIEDRTGAETLHNAVLLAEAIDDPDALWVHELIGARIVDVEGRDRGVVVAVLANPASDLLELDSGQLVPLTFVTGWQPDGRLGVDPPAGLLDDDEADAAAGDDDAVGRP